MILDLAECLNTHLPLGPGEERFIRPECVVWMGGGDHPAMNVVQRFRLSHDDVNRTVASVRQMFRDRGRTRMTWEVGPSSTPRDLYDRLIALGMRPYEEPLAHGMVLTRAPSFGDVDGVLLRGPLRPRR